MATPPLLDLDSLLVPISPERPSGQNLTYEPDYDVLREARRSEDDTLQGEWKRNAKTAQWDRVVALGTNLIQRRSKDLQVAAWVTEAATKLHGFAGLRDGLRLLHTLQQTFWDSCFPEMEDGDLEPRQGPYLFLNATRTLPLAIRSIPLTAGFSGQEYSYLRWQESRDIDNTGLKNPELMATLVAEGKITGEQFDAAVAQTPRSFYEALVADLNECVAAFKALDDGNDARFGRDAPGLGEIRKALDDCRTRLEPILAAKRAQEPDPEVAAEVEPAADQDQDQGGGELGTEPSSETQAPAPRRAAATRGTGGPITSVAQAVERIREAAAYLRAQDPSRPVSYLVVRALRMGELYALGQPPDTSQCEAPSRETRQRLKRLAAEGDWNTLLEQAEQSVGGVEGSAWLDAERYALTAMAAASDADRAAAAVACRSLLRALLSDFPALPEGELNDGTPAANAETRAWIAAEILPPPATPEPVAEPPPLIQPAAALENGGGGSADAEATRDAAPNVWEQAQELVRGGRVADALQLVRQAMNTATTGRERFYRKLQLAEICLLVNNHRLALPLSEDLARQVDEFHLEQWEDEAWSARVWATLYRCLRHAGAANANGNAERLQAVFTRLCRLDINQALVHASETAPR
jgi:type VI secretion system protein ImpA